MLNVGGAGRGLLRSGVVALVVLSVAVTVQAQQRFDVQQFHPMPGQQTHYFSVASARVFRQWQWEAGVLAHYSDDPLVLVDDHQERLVSLISGQMTLNLLGAVGLLDWLELGVDVPLILYQDGDDYSPIDYQYQGELAVGDLRLVPRLMLLSTETRQDPTGVTLGLLANVFLPTGNNDAFQGEGFRVEPRAVVDFAFPRGFRISANLGYLVRPAATFLNVDVDDTFTYGAAMWFPLSEVIAVVPELRGETSVLAEEIHVEEVPLELLIGAKLFPVDGLLIEAGLGMGLIQGFGAPDWRGMLGISSSQRPPQDRDLDGYLNDEDGCPDDPEDFDGFEDEDGCSDPDNDQDGILDVDDECPLDPEDPDDFEDLDGCPDPDNDRDGIPDVNDECALVPEDLDDFEDANGCPDPDNDQDGILDEDDICPLEPETFNEYEDRDGCPDEAPIVVQTCLEIELRESVFFDSDSDVIQSRSFVLLDNVAQVLINHADILRVRVEGHTDDRGSARHNLELSQRRAESVQRYLVQAGVEPGRLIAVGYGEDRPIADNSREDGRAENRRVMLRILEQENCEPIATPY